MTSQASAVERKVPLLDLRALHQPIREEILAQLTRVVDAQAFIMGEDVKALEKSIAEYCRVPYAIGCASGSDALVLALMAAGVKQGDAVGNYSVHFLRHRWSHCPRRCDASLRGYSTGNFQHRSGMLEEGFGSQQQDQDDHPRSPFRRLRGHGPDHGTCS